jgi:aminoglycoside 2''-phosphotransferase
MKVPKVPIVWRKIETENPGLSVRSVCFLGEGWNCRAYLVNSELVFRFPKRPEHWEELEREIAFLAFAAPRLPLAVPEYVRVARDSPSAAYGYAAYRYLRGNAMDIKDLTCEERASAADAIAMFLRALHGLQPNPDMGSSLPREDPRMVAEEYLARAEREVLPKLPALEARALRKQFDLYLNTSANFLFRPAVLHADLSGDHILMDADSIGGVIDFGDVCWGDPDYDFMYLSVEFGQAFVEEVARRYGHSDLGDLGIKLHYFSLVDQIGTILDGAGRALEGQEDAAWRRLKELLQRPEYG